MVPLCGRVPARQCRCGMPMARKAGTATGLEKSEKRGVQAARNGPSADRKCWQRVELGIHGLNRWTAKCIEMYGKRGVQAARNGPSADKKCWQRARLGIHGLNRWTAKCIEMYGKRGVHAARNGPSPPPTPAGGPVARPEIGTADRLGSREGSSRAGPPQGWGVTC